MPVLVPSKGPLRADVFLIGEAPGKQEARAGQPFVGRSGYEQEKHLEPWGVGTHGWRVGNIIPEYTPGNPDPTPGQIARYSAALEAEIRECGPNLIIACGAFAVRWLLGDSASIRRIYGLPHHGGAFDASIAYRSCGAIVIPILHPAAGFRDRDKGGKALAQIAWCYRQVADAVKALPSLPIVPVDEHPNPSYRDIGGYEMAKIIREAVAIRHQYRDGLPRIALDTEGLEGHEWSLQISHTPGTGYVCRTARRDFAAACEALQAYASRGYRIYIQNAMHDAPIMRGWGSARCSIDLSAADVYDTMFAAYLLRREPRGEKDLAYRWCRIVMRSFVDVCGDAGKERQLDYLREVVDRAYPRPEVRFLEQNDGTIKRYQPLSPSTIAKKIINDVEAGKETKDGPVTPYGRWSRLDWRVRVPVERDMGEMQQYSLGDVELEDAVEYAGKDPDALLRIGLEAERRIEEEGLAHLMSHDAKHLHFMEHCAWSGMHERRDKFEELHNYLAGEKRRTRLKLQSIVGGGPLNPGSSKQVQERIILGLGLRALKKTAAGLPSTAEDSIGYLKGHEPAIDLSFEWRQYNTTDSRYPVEGLRQMDIRGVDEYPRGFEFKRTRTPTRRLSAANPNRLAFPSRSKVGMRVKQCYVGPRLDERRWVYYAADYSQIELRCMAHQSRDERLIARFLADEDLHTATAADILGKDLADVTSSERSAFKATGFGIPYGLGPKGLWLQLKKQGLDQYSEDDCAQLIDDYLELYPQLAAYMERVKVETAQHPECKLTHISGHINFFPGLRSPDARTREEDRRAVFSYMIQEHAQSIIQEATVGLIPRVRAFQERYMDAGWDWKSSMRAKRPMAADWRLQIHDELVATVREDLIEEFDAMIKDGMVGTPMAQLCVPVKVDSSWGYTWADTK